MSIISVYLIIPGINGTEQTDDKRASAAAVKGDKARGLLAVWPSSKNSYRGKGAKKKGKKNGANASLSLAGGRKSRPGWLAFRV